MREKILELEKFILRTQLIPFHNRDLDLQSKIYFKPENLQIFGSYKIRGIVSALKECDPHTLQSGLAAASAGNMAQAVAFSARQLAVPCRIYVPDAVPQTKLSAIQALEAEVIKMPYAELWKFVRGEVMTPDDRFFIHPVFNSALLKGYSAIAHEIIEDMPDADAIVIPFGVGGLTLGIGKAMQQLNPQIAIYACEPETAAPLKTSLDLNKPTAIQRTPSFVDAIGTPEVLPEVFQQILPIIKDSLVVSLNDIKQALKNIFFKNKLISEGAAACALAAALQLAKLGMHEKIVCVLSGGNIDPNVLQDLIN